jgi:DNA topoisomerase-3
VRTLDSLSRTVEAFSADERRLYEVIAGLFLQSVAPDYAYEETTLTLTLGGRVFTGRATVPLAQGWRVYLAEAERTKPDDEIEVGFRVTDGAAAEVVSAAVTTKTTRAPERFNEGTLVMAMKNAAKYIRNPALKARLEDAKGIGTQATRDGVITGLKEQGMIEVKAGKIYPTAAGNAVFATLFRTAPDLIDPGLTAVWENRLDEIARGVLGVDAFVDEISAEVHRLLTLLKASPPSPAFGTAVPTKKMLDAVATVQRATGQAPPGDYRTNFAACKAYLDAHPRQGAQAPSSVKAS